MQKFIKIVLLAVISFYTIPSYIAYAETYRVINIRGCVAMMNNDTIHEGNVVPANAKLKVIKTTDGSSWTIKLQSTSSGKIHPLCSPSYSTDASKNDSDSWISSLWNSLTGQKKCSTRAPENELTEGLMQNLSQTFYLYYPYDNNSDCDIDFATNLNNKSLLRCSYNFNNRSYMFDIPITNGMYSLSSKYFVIYPDEERTILKIDVKCILDNGEIIPITDSMNVILIHD